MIFDSSRFKLFVKEYEGKRILVTGATGFLGSNLTEALLDVDCEIIRMTRNRNLNPIKNSVAKVTDLKGDIRERPVWEEALKDVDYVFHFAAQTSITLAEKDSYVDFNWNVLPMVHLLNICRETKKTPVILFASTVTTTGLPEKLPVTEDHEDDPLTAYCLHKLTAETYLKDYIRLGSVQGVVLRLSNVYGPGPEASKSDRGILNRMIRRAAKGETLYLYGNADKLRDYIYIEDVILAFLGAGIHIHRLNGKHFIIGSGEGRTLLESFQEVARQVSEKKGKSVSVELSEEDVELPVIEERNFVADSSLFSGMVGWKPKYSLEEGIHKTIELMS